LIKKKKKKRKKNKNEKGGEGGGGGLQLAQINTTQSRSLLSFYVDPMLSAIKLTNLFSRIASNSLRFLTRAAFEEYNGSSAK